MECAEEHSLLSRLLPFCNFALICSCSLLPGRVFRDLRSEGETFVERFLEAYEPSGEWGQHGGLGIRPQTQGGAAASRSLLRRERTAGIRLAWGRFDNDPASLCSISTLTFLSYVGSCSIPRFIGGRRSMFSSFLFSCQSSHNPSISFIFIILLVMFLLSFYFMVRRRDDS